MSETLIDRKLLREKLKEYFGFTSFKGNQEEVIMNLLSGRDTFVLMPTGGGKSLCYQLPAMMMDGVAIIISPLIALMKNQVDAMRTFSDNTGIAHFLNSSLSRAAVQQVRDEVLAGKTKLLYFAPESLTKEDNIAFLRIKADANGVTKAISQLHAVSIRVLAHILQSSNITTVRHCDSPSLIVISYINNGAFPMGIPILFNIRVCLATMRHQFTDNTRIIRF